MSNFLFDRRSFLAGAGALGLSACAPSAPNYRILDQESLNVKTRLFNTYAPAKRAAEDAAGYLVFPEITKAGLVVGGMTGEGTLYSKDNVIGHYAVKAGSVGLQAGLQYFSMIVYFMTEEAMANFRAYSGVEIGTDVEYALPDYGSASYGASSATYRKPVYALIFNQGGAMLGASLKGAIYTAI